MLPEFLIPETTVREAGTGQYFSLEENRGGVLLLTLGITRIIEHQSLDLSIWGSGNGVEWGTKPLIGFPLKFYCGTYQLQLDLSGRPDVTFLRAGWKVNRWGKSDAKPLFTLYLFASILQPALVAVGA
jgi:hypothetical protein